IVLVGEIRDAETAQIACQAAMTGHLVLSTLHTNDTASSVTRLGDLGIEQFQITTSVLGILATRLLRKICLTCREVSPHSPEELKLLGLTKEQVAGKKLYRARSQGCSACKFQGYIGRIGIYELLVFDDEIRAQVLRSLDGSVLKKMCVQRG